jgi:thiol-disulfide isomerase/thioredoxin
MKRAQFVILIVGLGICSCTRKVEEPSQSTMRVADTMAQRSDSDIARLRDSLLQAQVRYHASQPLANGKLVPHFQVRLMRTGESVTNATFAGKYYLLHFWGTHCGPCLAEMGELHKAYAKYKNNNFTILSFAFGDTASVVQFRETKWAIPWYNVALFDNLNNSIWNDFQAYGIPCHYLVDPSGVILAQGSALRGKRFQETLARFIK